MAELCCNPIMRLTVFLTFMPEPTQNILQLLFFINIFTLHYIITFIIHCKQPITNENYEANIGVKIKNLGE